MSHLEQLTEMLMFSHKVVYHTAPNTLSNYPNAKTMLLISGKKAYSQWYFDTVGDLIAVDHHEA
jgi:hypothetical protein